MLLKGRVAVGGFHNRDLVPWALTSMGLLIGRLQLLVCSLYLLNILDISLKQESLSQYVLHPYRYQHGSIEKLYLTFLQNKSHSYSVISI